MKQDDFSGKDLKSPGSIQQVPIIIQELAGINRINEPVTFGIPFPRGVVFDSTELRLIDYREQPVPLQAQTLICWPDQSLKWVLLDFQAAVEAMGNAEYQLQYGNAPAEQIQPPIISINLNQRPDSIAVDTKAATFCLDTRILRPFERIVVQGKDIITSSQIVLTDEFGREYESKIRAIEVETAGSLRTTLKIQGELSSDRQKGLAHFICRISFYANSNLVKLDYTIRNPKAAKHPGGLWDLGDEGSVYFKDLSIFVAVACEQPTIEWSAQPNLPLSKSNSNKLVIYQDSSGGVNWKSLNHVNRFGKVMNTFRGYRVYADGIVGEGERANPIVGLGDNNKRVEVAVQKFWQNFPKAIEAQDNTLRVRLFPAQYADVFELQGGEQKTHTVFFAFGTNPTDLPGLNWVQSPLVPRTTPQWYADSKAFSYLVPYSQDRNSECLKNVDLAVKGDNTFFARREIIDEYGWRHFGDIYSDHEAVSHKGDTPLIAHYNNQYDVIYGAIIQYVRSGNTRWFELMDDLSKHVRDIDIYHTDQDRAVYNNGLFWHTDHYTDAATCTHRSYSRQTLIAKGLSSYGGGPCNEHNYAAGLAYHYFLTGQIASREAAIGLADWVINMDDGSKTRFRFIDRRPTGFASSTAERDYHGPGRGCGNSISVLIDAHLLTQEEKYLLKAEDLIRRTIHPKDDIDSRNLVNNPEARWSYTVYLQIIGKYLDYKLALGQTDYMYCYAGESLIHYAKWMAKNEVRFATILDKVVYPTETWSAQDIRKSNVFKFAAKYGQESLHGQFLEKSDFFFNACINDLLIFETRTLARPVAILMSSGYMQAYFQQHPNETARQVLGQYDFGQPQRFIPQVYGLYKLREKTMAIVHAIKGRIN